MVTSQGRCSLEKIDTSLFPFIPPNGAAGVIFLRRSVAFVTPVTGRVNAKFLTPAPIVGKSEHGDPAAGAAGLNAALGAQDRGLRVLALEKNKIANIIEDFPEGKWIYADKRVSKQFASQRMASSRLRLAAIAITPFGWCWPRGSATIHAAWA